MRNAAVAFAVLAVVSAAVPARAAWEFRDEVTALGDRGTGIVEPDAEGVGATFVFACDRDRWRRAGLVPTRGRPLRMDEAGKIRFSFDDGIGPAGLWRAIELEDGLFAYEIPQPGDFVRKMVQEERKNPDARLRIELLRENGKRAKLYFPLKGLGEAIRRDLWAPCKLDVYLGDPPPSASPPAPGP